MRLSVSSVFHAFMPVGRRIASVSRTLGELASRVRSVRRTVSTLRARGTGLHHGIRELRGRGHGLHGHLRGCRGPSGGSGGDDAPPSGRGVGTRIVQHAGSLQGGDNLGPNKRPKRRTRGEGVARGPGIIRSYVDKCYHRYNHSLSSVTKRLSCMDRIISLPALTPIIERCHRCGGAYAYKYYGEKCRPHGQNGRMAFNGGVETIIACLDIIRYVPCRQLTSLVRRIFSIRVDRNAVGGVIRRTVEGSGPTVGLLRSVLEGSPVINFSRSNYCGGGGLS